VCAKARTAFCSIVVRISSAIASADLPPPNRMISATLCKRFRQISEASAVIGLHLPQTIPSGPFVLYYPQSSPRPPVAAEASRRGLGAFPAPHGAVDRIGNGNASGPRNLDGAQICAGFRRMVLAMVQPQRDCGALRILLPLRGIKCGCRWKGHTSHWRSIELPPGRIESCGIFRNSVPGMTLKRSGL
jgi:hypothetical protein